MKRIDRDNFRPSFFVTDTTNIGFQNRILNIKNQDGDPVVIQNNNALETIKKQLPVLGSGQVTLQHSYFLEKLGVENQLGLFTTSNKTFQKGEIITSYYGWHVFHNSRGWTKREYSHAMPLLQGVVTILGNYTTMGKYISKPLQQMIGHGVAAYSNTGANFTKINNDDDTVDEYITLDRDTSLWQADLMYLETSEYQNLTLEEKMDPDYEFDCHSRLIVLVAKGTIPPNTEILCNYGPNYKFKYKGLTKEQVERRGNLETYCDIPEEEEIQETKPLQCRYCDTSFTESFVMEGSHNSKRFCDAECQKGFYQQGQDVNSTTTTTTTPNIGAGFGWGLGLGLLGGAALGLGVASLGRRRWVSYDGYYYPDYWAPYYRRYYRRHHRFPPHWAGRGVAIDRARGMSDAELDAYYSRQPPPGDYY